MSQASCPSSKPMPMPRRILGLGCFAFLVMLMSYLAIGGKSRPILLHNQLNQTTTKGHNQDGCRSAPANESSPNRGRFYLCVKPMGRLGNHMFQYASVYGIAKSQNRIPLIVADDLIHKYFNIWAEKQPVPPRRKGVCDGMTKHGEKRASAYDVATVTFPPGQDIWLNGSLQSYYYFKGYEKDIRQQFRLPDSLVRKAKAVLEKQLATVLNPNSTRPKLVALHVRRGDRTNKYNVKFGMTTAPKEYILKAQRYFLEKYKHVIFVVCSDSMDWCLDNLPSNRTVFIQNQSLGVDFAVMTQCDDVIMTVGTFGWWVAWLVNGETVYYEKRFDPNSPLAAQWDMSHHYPPHWIPML